jgi:N-acylglucosamine 2-epimerase
VLPFWRNHGIDWKNGGVQTFLRDDGSLFDSDKSVLSNLRALWTFSALARRPGADRFWSAAAENTYRFLKQYGQAENGMWSFLLAEDGRRLIEPRSIITSAFAIYGLVEYYLLSREDRAIRLALETYEVCRDRLQNPGSYSTILYPTPGNMRAHRESMQFSLMLYELASATGDTEILREAMRHSDLVLDLFYREELGTILEYVGPDGPDLSTPEGRTVVPGHAIESLWFQIHLRSSAEVADPTGARRAAAALRRPLELGWDAEYGGIFLGMDVEGKTPVYWKLPETKRWWSHCEALCATLLAYEQLKEDWCLDWYWRVHNWSFERFPDQQHGEWFQNLDRAGKPYTLDGKPSSDLDIPKLANLTGAGEIWLKYDFRVKDPFHLPRALLVAIDTLRRLGMESQ